MSPATVEREAVRRAMEDVEFFARVCVGEPLWPHQLGLAVSPARIRVARAGRQVGKSRLLAVLALWEAFRAPNRHVLILSAGEDSANDLLAEVVSLAMASPLLAGSIEDESMSRVILSNGSWVRSIPASAKQARGKSIDLLIIDEAAFVSEDVWRAAKYSQAARPGSRLLLASSPYGRRDAFFAVHDRLGLGGLTDVAGVTVETFVWPSTVSPLVREAGLVEFWRRTDPPRVFAAEVLAEWQDEQGAYFTAEEIDGAVADYEMITPGASWPRGDTLTVGGIDWGMQVDSHALVLLAGLCDGGMNVERCGLEPVYWIPHLEVHQQTSYHEFIDRILAVCDRRQGGFDVRYLVSETNGVGSAPTETLEMQAWRRRLRTKVVPAHTTAKRKQHAFGQVKLLLQRGRLVLPRHPELLRQLHALQFETLESGTVRIAVPESGGGHDDVVMALAQAVSTVRPSIGRRWGRPDAPDPDDGDELMTPGGTRIATRPRSWTWNYLFQPPKGADGPEEGW